MIQMLFSTKNKDKILSNFNKLSLSDKQLFLSIDKVKMRLSKIADIDLLTNMLIYLPYEFRHDFLRILIQLIFPNNMKKQFLNF